MTRLSAVHTATASLGALLLASTLIAQAADQTAPAVKVSKVRIVRLSQVKGAVELDRDNGRSFETAIANLPIVEKSRLRTDDGVAEVEFEDNSSLRLAPDSMVEFPRLERMPGGTTVSSVRVLKGTAYVSLMRSPGNEFNLLFGQQSIRLPGATHVRLQLEDSQARLAVLDGTVRVEGPSGEIEVPRKKTVTFALTDSAEPHVSKDVAADTYDSWDRNAAEYHERLVSSSALSGSPYTYGQNDMMYYGSFADMGSCGSMWRPYFASAAWDPYSNGSWAWYQDAGYSWVSPYPWGWTPYHYGAWSYCPGAGWGWQPGGAWMGLNNGLIAAANEPRKPPVAPAHPPAAGEPALLGVNRKPMVQSEIASPTSFVFRKDSAGMGIPRDELGKLDKFSQRTLEKGAVSEHVYLDAPSGAGSAAFAVAEVHRGAPPASSSSTQVLAPGAIGSGGSANASTSEPSSRSSSPSAGRPH
jgi:hypothetical protein